MKCLLYAKVVAEVVELAIPVGAVAADAVQKDDERAAALLFIRDRHWAGRAMYHVHTLLQFPNSPILRFPDSPIPRFPPSRPYIASNVSIPNSPNPVLRYRAVTSQSRSRVGRISAAAFKIGCAW